MLDVKKIYKSYNEHLVLYDVNFTVKQGEIFGVIGPNGAGKTTLFEIIAGLLPPNSGEVKIDNVNIQIDSIEIKKKIGYVPESFFIYKKLTGSEFLNFIGDVKKIPSLQKEKEIENFLRKFDLFEKKDDLIETYSLGMRKKIAISAAFMGSPSLLLLDEPTTGLDVIAIYSLKESIIDRVQKGAAVLIASHVIDFIENLCDKVMILNNSRVVGINLMRHCEEIREENRLEKKLIKLTNKRSIVID